MSKSDDKIEFRPSVDDSSVYRTVRCKLETSDRKNKKVERGIKAFHQVIDYLTPYMPTYPDEDWNVRNNHMYHHAKRGLPDDDADIKKTVALDAQKKLAEAYESWKKKGKPGNRPQLKKGNRNYIRIGSQYITIKKNEKGWGIKFKFISYEPEWFQIVDGEYQRDFLQQITNENSSMSAGNAELHLRDDGTLFCHLSVNWSVDTYDISGVSTRVGVDLNVDPLAVVAVWDGEEVCEVEFISGAEFSHNRERLKRSKDQAAADGNLKMIREGERNYQNYTKQVTDNVAHQVVKMAKQHTPSGIHIEDLKYIQNNDGASHDWPYAQIQQQIVSRAKEEGIPVARVDPDGTSQECRKCGSDSNTMRDGWDFKCFDCEYAPHADLNAAINIAQREPIEADD